jgi:hypothetical protein
MNPLLSPKENHSHNRSVERCSDLRDRTRDNPSFNYELYQFSVNLITALAETVRGNAAEEPDSSVSGNSGYNPLETGASKGSS